MEDHLEKIRRENPNLNPTETYALLSDALIPEVLAEEVDFESLFSALDQYEDRLDGQLSALRDRQSPRSAEDLLEQGVEEWFKDLRADHTDLDSALGDIEEIALNLPEKARIEEFVAGKIQNEYPQFNMEYLEHQKWLEINAERLARQKQMQFRDEPDQTRSQDGLAR